jgi:hypothetical protein
MQATRVKPGTGGSAEAAAGAASGAVGGHSDDGGRPRTPTGTTAVPVITNPGAGTLSTKAAAAKRLAAAQAPGPALAVGVMEDELNPRPVYFADELLGGEADEAAQGLAASGGGRGGGSVGGTSDDAGVLGQEEHPDGPIEHDTLFRRGVVVGGRASADDVPPPQLPVPLSPHYPRARRVVGLTSGHAHTSFITDDGRLWLIGMRGRGVLFDDSGEPGQEDAEGGGAEAGSAAAAPCLSPRAPVAARAAVSSATAPGLSAVAAPPLPQLTVQLRPWEVAPGPLAGHTVVRLRSSTHHSYALTQEGRVFRWGWRGVVLPVRELEGEAAEGGPRLQVADIQFGHSHAMLLACEQPAAAAGAPGPAVAVGDGA